MSLFNQIREHSGFILCAELILLACALLSTDSTSGSLAQGSILIVSGASLYTWAAFYLAPWPKTGFKLAGPFRFVRYPTLLARFLMLTGFFIVARTPLLFLCAVVGLAGFYRRIAQQQDQLLAAELGPLATEYRASVSGFIPQALPARIFGQHPYEKYASNSWGVALWSRPSLAGFVWLGVVTALILQAVWTQRYLLDWQWRLVVLVIMISLGFIIYKYLKLFQRARS